MGFRFSHLCSYCPIYETTIATFAVEAKPRHILVANESLNWTQAWHERPVQHALGRNLTDDVCDIVAGSLQETCHSSATFSMLKGPCLPYLVSEFRVLWQNYFLPFRRLQIPCDVTYMSYGQNSVHKLMDAKLGVSLFRWSRRFTWALCPNCDCSTCPPHTKFLTTEY